MNSKPVLLVLAPISQDYLVPLQQWYTIVHLGQLGDMDRFLAEDGPFVTALLTNGIVGVPGHLKDRLPSLGIVACNGVGYDGIDLQWAKNRNITVTNTPEVLSGDVADLAMALMLAVFRNIPRADAFVREGAWLNGKLPLARRLWGSKVGILGLGRIGNLIAQRCYAFDMAIGYYARNQRPDSPHRYFSVLTELAQWCDVLVVATPGGHATASLVSAPVLEALGSGGVLINIARGSVVDEQALIHALETGQTGGAGLDVFAHEPHVPETLLNLPNVVLTPHIASATVQTRAAMASLVVDNLIAYAEKKPLLTAVSVD